MNIPIYMIRHKVTKEYMPQMKGRVGYIYWNPATKTHVRNSLGFPRIFTSRAKATRVIIKWASGNISNNIKGESKQIEDGRDLQDLQIIKAYIVPKSIMPLMENPYGKAINPMPEVS